MAIWDPDLLGARPQRLEMAFRAAKQLDVGLLGEVGAHMLHGSSGAFQSTASDAGGSSRWGDRPFSARGTEAAASGHPRRRGRGLVAAFCTSFEMSCLLPAQALDMVNWAALGLKIKSSDPGQNMFYAWLLIRPLDF